MKDYTEIQLVKDKIKLLNEDTLTQKLIIPLLEKTGGFFKVEYNCGTQERGKDILCWDKGTFDEISLTVAQVKVQRFNFSSSGAKGSSFFSLITQLNQILDYSVSYTDGSSHKPNKIYVITSFPVKTNDFENYIVNHNIFKNNQVPIELIDLNRLTEKLIKFIPDILSDLFGLNININKEITSTLNNRALLNILGFSGIKELNVIFTDIDFAVGKPTTKLFFDSYFKPIDFKVNLDEVDYSNFKDTVKILSKIIQNNYIDLSYKEIEKNYNNGLIKYKNYLKKKLESDNIKIDIEEPKYSFIIKGSKLANSIESIREYIEDQINKFNTQHPSIHDLKEFIDNYNQIIETISLTFENKSLKLALGVNNNNISRRGNYSNTRLHIPLDLIFETGLNISILGDAGGGKTTNLQYYTFKKLTTTQDKLYIYAPLSVLIHFWISKDLNLTKIETTNRNLEVGLSYYLNHIGINIDVDTLSKKIDEKGATILLDGIDEIINIAPWIINCINIFAKKYSNNLQLVVSSRDINDLQEKFSFFTTVLMPFTKEQLDLFILRWFNNDKYHINYISIIKHIKANNALYEIIDNPLNATILCVLAEKNNELPRTEVQLFEQRFKLLIGYYDYVKGVVRIKTPLNQLENLARKIAFYFHLNGVRSKTFKDIIDICAELEFEMNAIQLEQAINELISPCNILIPMNVYEEYGFGHLKFQEFLAATEIYHNREIDILKLLKNEYWKEVFVHLSNMYSSITWLFKYIVQTDQKRFVDNNILLHIKENRSEDEQNEITKVWNMNYKNMKYEGIEKYFLNRGGL